MMTLFPTVLTSLKHSHSAVNGISLKPSAFTVPVNFSQHSCLQRWPLISDIGPKCKHSWMSKEISPKQ